MMMMTTRPVLPPPESDVAGAGATTGKGVKVADGETAAGDREAVCDCGDPEDDGVPVTVGVVEALGGPTGEDELDGDAGTVAVADADVPLERVAVGVSVGVPVCVAVLDGVDPRLSDAVDVGVPVALLERVGVKVAVGVADVDAPRDSVAVNDDDCDSVAVAVLDGDAPRLSDAVAVGVRVAFCEPVGVPVALLLRVGENDGVCDGVKGTHARSVAKPGSAGCVHDVTLVSAKPCVVAMVGDTHDEPPPPPPRFPAALAEPAPPPK